MGNKLTLNDVANLQNESSVVTTLALNNRAIEAAVENTLSRDGSDPNYMQDNLDMNSKRILNLPAPIVDTDPVRLIDLGDGVSPVVVNPVPAGGLTGQGLYKNSNIDYDYSWQNTALNSVALAPAQDFNLATNVGWYYTVDTSSTNTPIVANFYLMVESIPSLGFVKQTATARASGLTWIRVSAGLGWTAWVQIAPMDSPSFTGIPLAPTAAAGTNTTQLATTAFVTGAVREKLTGARNYYVNGSTGSDSNNGLSTGTAFATIQKAVDTVCSLDMSIYQVYIIVADATYSAAVVLKNYVGALMPGIVGNTTTPSNCVVSATGTSCFTSDNAPPWLVQGFKVQTTGGGSGFDIKNGGVLYYGYINFGTISAGYAHIRALGAGSVTCNAPCSITGNAEFHVLAALGGIVTCTGQTFTVTGTPAFGSAFAFGTQVGNIYSSGSTWTGAATGTRYSCNLNSVMYTGGAGANHFPGSVAGSTTAGGQYS